MTRTNDFSSGRLTSLGLTLMLALCLTAGCGGGGSQKEQASEEETSKQGNAQKVEEKTTPSPFEGEHENLQSGDTAIWRQGLELTITDVHISPNQSRATAEKSRKAQEARGKEAKKSLAEEGPEQLVVYTLSVQNNGQAPINFGGGVPCEALDPNGVSLPPSGGISEEQSKTAKTRPLEQPLEPGQARTGVYSFAPPTEGTTFEIVCAHPPQSGGKPNIAQIPEQGKASWSINVSELEFRDVRGP